jgi:hypothetical protein
MSAGNRDKGPIGLNDQLSLLTGVVLACLIVGILAYTEGHRDERRNHGALQYAQQAKRNAIEACYDREPRLVADCVYDEIQSAAEKSESRQDLEAQQWMARWAAILTVITLVTTLISWLALRYLRDTFRQTAVGAKAASEATEEMRKSNEFARQLARPWVTIECRITRCRIFDGKALIDGEVIYRNIGQTPAHGISMFHQVFSHNEQFPDKLLEFFRRTQNMGDWGGDSLLPNEVFVRYIREDHPIADAEEIDDHGIRGIQILIGATANYKSRHVPHSWGGLQTARCFFVMSRNSRGEWDRGFPESFVGGDEDTMRAAPFEVGTVI